MSPAIVGFLLGFAVEGVSQFGEVDGCEFDEGQDERAGEFHPGFMTLFTCHYQFQRKNEYNFLFYMK